MRKLKTVFSLCPDCVIFIDDARTFHGGDYPKLSKLRDHISGKAPGWSFEIKDDIIRLHERQGA